jgi:hypothetical protein
MEVAWQCRRHVPARCLEMGAQGAAAVDCLKVCRPESRESLTKTQTPLRYPGVPRADGKIGITLMPGAALTADEPTVLGHVNEDHVVPGFSSSNVFTA